MTKDVNQVSIVGNLVSDPEFQKINESEVACLRIATGRVKNERGKKEAPEGKETTIHEVRVFVDHIVSLIKNLKKGDRVVICGEVRNTRMEFTSLC